MEEEEESKERTGGPELAHFLGQGAQVRLSSPVLISTLNSSPKHLESLRRVQKTAAVLNST